MDRYCSHFRSCFDFSLPCSESGGSQVGGMLGQIFNIGVPIFFILSGYLHGQKSAPKNRLKWYGRKLRRLLLPLYIFLAILAAFYLFTGLSIDLSIWWQTIVPICGLTQKYIPGCGQLWFLTHLLICYLLTPLLQEHARLKKRGIVLMSVIWLAACVLLAYTVPPIWCTLLNSLLSYAVGFYVLPHLLHRKYHYGLLLGIAFLSCCCRLAFRRFFDGTPFYNSVATELCSLALALSIIAFLFRLGELFEAAANSSVKSCVAALGKRTYEFYLVHYIFLTGPLKVKNLQSGFLSIAVAFLLSLVLSEFIIRVEKIISKK